MHYRLSNSRLFGKQAGAGAIADLLGYSPTSPLSQPNHYGEQPIQS